MNFSESRSLVFYNSNMPMTEDEERINNLPDVVKENLIAYLPMKLRTQLDKSTDARWAALNLTVAPHTKVVEMQYCSVKPDLTVAIGNYSFQLQFPTENSSNAPEEIPERDRWRLEHFFERWGRFVRSILIGGRSGVHDMFGLNPDYMAQLTPTFLECLYSRCTRLTSLHLKNCYWPQNVPSLEFPYLKTLCLHNVRFPTQFDATEFVRPIALKINDLSMSGLDYPMILAGPLASALTTCGRKLPNLRLRIERMTFEVPETISTLICPLLLESESAVVNVTLSFEEERFCRDLNQLLMIGGDIIRELYLDVNGTTSLESHRQEYLFFDIHRLKNLHTFVLSGRTKVFHCRSSVFLAEGLSLVPALRSLTIKNSFGELKGRSWREFCEKLIVPNLETLTIVRGKDIKSEYVEIMSKNAPNLRNLTFRYCDQLGGRLLGQILDNLRQLETLQIQRNERFHPADFYKMTSHPRLQYASIANNSVNGLNEAIERALKRKFPIVEREGPTKRIYRIASEAYRNYHPFRLGAQRSEHTCPVCSQLVFLDDGEDDNH